MPDSNRLGSGWPDPTTAEKDGRGAAVHINLRLVLSGGAAIVVALITAFAQPAVGAVRTPTKINAPTKFVVALFLKGSYSYDYADVDNNT